MSARVVLALMVLSPMLARAGETYVICAGVEKYDDARLSPLQYAVSDAKAVAAAFRASGVPRKNVQVLTSDAAQPTERPTRIGLIAALQQVRDKATRDDTLVLFFAGHGVEQEGQQYLLTVDTRRDLMAFTALPMPLINEALKGLQAGQVLFLIDACRNDPDAGRGQVDTALTDALARGLRPRIASPAGKPLLVATLLACDIGQRAWEAPEQKHGVFTVYLLKGMAGAAAGPNGAVSLSGLSSYVQQQMSEWSKRSGREQQPRLVNPDGGDMTVLVPPKEPLVSVTVANEPLATLVTRLAEEYGVDIVLGEGVDGTIKLTGRIENQPVSKVLNALLSAVRLELRQQGKAYVIQRTGAATPNQAVVPKALRVFPICAWLRDQPSDEVRAAGEEAVRLFYRERVTGAKEAGFDTVSVPLGDEELDSGSSPLADEATAAGLDLVFVIYSFVNRLNAKGGIESDEASVLVDQAARLVSRYDNALAWVFYSDPVRPQWLPTWQRIGPAMVKECPAVVPGLAAYRDWALFQRYQQACPMPVYVCFGYCFNDGNSPADSLRGIPFSRPNPVEARNLMPGNRCWAWMPLFTASQGKFREPTSAESRGLAMVGLALGIKGYIYFFYSRPDRTGLKGALDADGRPTKMLQDLSRALPEIKRMGTILLDCRIVDNVVAVTGQACASYQVSPSGDRYVMLASQNAAAAQDVTISLSGPATSGMRGMQDALTGEPLPGSVANGQWQAKVKLGPGDGRLFRVVSN